jgi:Zn-dependent M28 family amino/carboxypeptidase
MKKNILIISIVSISFAANAQQINQSNLKKHISYLADDKLKGRGTGSAEEKLAADYIISQFKEYKLQPKGNKDYLYSFTFKKNLDPHDTVTVNKPEVNTNDIVAFLDNKAENTIIIGAHYDHLGMGFDKNSLDANPENKIHNGADDNASGVAGVLELARYFATNKEKENYNFLFICFSGEELGLYGSKKYADNPTIDFAKVNYMINMDMIGRLNDSTKKAVVYGVGTAPEFVSIIDKIKTDLSIKKDSSGIGPSDHTSFYLKNLPVLHFFSGQHSDYHKPSDDEAKINYNGEVQILQLIVAVIDATNKLPKLKFTPTKNIDKDNTPSFKVTMGVMPDYTYEGKGLHIDGVTENKPAFKAGIVKDDIVIQLGEYKVDTIQDYMKALSKYKKGDSTTVKVLRKDKEIILNITF